FSRVAITLLRHSRRPAYCGPRMRRVHLSMALPELLAVVSSTLSTWTWYLPSGTSSNSRSSIRPASTSSSHWDRSMSGSDSSSLGNPCPFMGLGPFVKRQRLAVDVVRGFDAAVVLGMVDVEPVLARSELVAGVAVAAAAVRGFPAAAVAAAAGG